MFVKSKRMVASEAAFIAATIFALAFTTVVDAQDQTQERLLACDRISDTEDRLECFNAVVGGIKNDVEHPAATAEVPEAPGVSVPPVPASVDVVPAAVVEEAASRPAAAPASPLAETADVPTVSPATAVTESADVPPVSPAAAVTESADVPPVSPATPVNEAADLPPVAPVSANSDFGLEDQKAKAAREAERERKNEEQSEVVYSTIVEVRRVSGGRFEAQLENGQVWRETEATRTVRRPKVGDSVRITSGRLGSYRMKFNNDNRLASVRRTE
ncbi:MAG: hypothetical protein ACR2Q3_19320 [Woeseiaceae bacterium]